MAMRIYPIKKGGVFLRQESICGDPNQNWDEHILALVSHIVQLVSLWVEFGRPSP